MTSQQHNFDTQELAKFAAIAPHWWDPTGEVQTLHQINPLRMAFLQEKINLAKKHVIDVGCGGGILTESMSSAGAIVTGIDLNKPLLDVAKLHQLESKTTVEYLLTSAEAIALERPNRYDVVTCFELLEHVPDPIAIINAAKTLLKPDGHLFLSTLNRNLKSYLFAIIGAEYILKLLPRNTHDYAKLIRPAELYDWVVECQLTPKEMKGIQYNPFKKTFSLSNDVSVNYILYAQKQ